jgi:ribosomal protein S18 acetylase RimI-like enzyme
MNLTLRTEAETDIPFLLQLYAESRAAELEPVPWTRDQKQQFLESQFRLQRKHYYQFYDRARFELILLEGIPVGRLYVHTGSEIRLMDIIVSQQYQKRGIARWCFEQLFLEAENTNLDITLHVELNNHARHWYKRLGFVELEDQNEASGVSVKMLRRTKSNIK